MHQPSEIQEALYDSRSENTDRIVGNQSVAHGELVERIVRWNIHPADLITHRFPLEKASEAYALMASGKCGKVAVCFDEELLS